MNREYDGIMRHWTPKPLKRRQIERARRHMASLLEAGATVLDSIPGGSAFSELVSIFGQHVVNRMVRG